MALVTHSELPELEIGPGIYMRAVNTDTVTVAHVRIDKGAQLPAHSHPHEQVVNVVEGRLDLVVDGVTHKLVPGTSMVLLPNVPHSGVAVEETRVVDVFHPVRKDFTGSSFGGYPSE
jgi:quercetin dioxygenase-like cupin family protein